MLQEIHIGVDDTDSHKGMCTTYLAALIVRTLEKYSVSFLDYPKLIRLNPNIPFKTRGNGAVALSFITTNRNVSNIWQDVVDLVKTNSDISEENTDPGLVMVIGKPKIEFQDFYKQALFKVITIKQVKHMLETNFLGKYCFIKKGRGLIGACAAIGANLNDDYTYELIAYRNPELKRSKRLIDVESVIIADRSNPLSFGNYDYIHKELMITPHGPDPVYVGIRGETSKSVIQMWRQIKIKEKIFNLMLFRSNQHTQPHFPKYFTGNELKPFLSVKIEGTIEKDPVTIDGGHVIFSLITNGRKINCAAYEPTKKFRKLVRELKNGDKIIVFGGVRPASEEYPITINLEQFIVLAFKKELTRISLKCPNCNAALKSLGKHQGLKCNKCSFQTSDKGFLFHPQKRKLRKGIRYIIPIRAQRHLTKPHERELALQFHLSTEENFGKEFSQFLRERRNLINQAKV
jgi:tRNA(Ile2)-agmatinylcytidine synthase